MKEVVWFLWLYQCVGEYMSFYKDFALAYGFGFNLASIWLLIGLCVFQQFRVVALVSKFPLWVDFLFPGSVRRHPVWSRLFSCVARTRSSSVSRGRPPSMGARLEHIQMGSCGSDSARLFSGN